jgi:hypothetical protein
MPTAETLEEIKPLDGDWVYSLKIHTGGDGRILAQRWRAMELQLRDRVRTQKDETHAGIGILDLFEAPPSEERDEQELQLPISLDQAMAYNPHSQRFLFSTTVAGLAVISSRIGYPGSGGLTVLPPGPSVYPNLDTTIDIRDYSDDTPNEDLSRRHIERIVELGGNPDAELDQSVIDSTFRYMVRCSPERR